MATVAPEILHDAIFSPSTVDHFLGSDKEKRLIAGETLLRVALIHHKESALARLNYDAMQRPFVAAIIGRVNYAHSGSTEIGWEYRDRIDFKRNRAVAYLNSPLPGMVELVGHAGKELSGEEDKALQPILPSSGSAEVARIYLLDKSFWSEDKIVKALTAELTKPLLGIRSTDQGEGRLLRMARGARLVGLGSAHIKDQYTMEVDLDVPGYPKTHQVLDYLVDIPGAAIMVGRRITFPPK